MARAELLAYDPAQELVDEIGEGPADDDETPRLSPEVLGRWIEESGRGASVPEFEETPPISLIRPSPRAAAAMAPPVRVPRWILAAFAVMFVAGAALIALTVLR